MANISFVSLKREIKQKIARVNALPRSTKRDRALVRLKKMKLLLPCPQQTMTVDL